MKPPFFKYKKRESDELQYYIPHKVIEDTERILSDFSSNQHPCEEIVYLAGIREANRAMVRLVVAPDAKTDSDRVVVSQDANFHFVKTLSARNFVQIAQVHTHPSLWVGHSPGDSKYAAFKVKWLVSIVVPVYCRKGMLPLEKRCGVFRFNGALFVRLSRKYVRTHFHILDNEKSEIKDLRKWRSS